MSQSVIGSSGSAKQSPESNDDGAHRGQPCASHSAAVEQLLIRYLELLDQYQKQQKYISKLFSSGFLSLAHANLTSTSGHRYGQDYYDERMKASITLPATPLDFSSLSQSHESNGTYSPIDFQRSGQAQTASLEHPGSSHTGIPTVYAIASGTSANVPRVPSEGREVYSTKLSQDSDSLQNDQNIASPTKSHDQNNDAAQDLLATDPIRWFGVLVPQSLKSAQSAFAESVEGPVCRSALILAEMHQLEEQIRCYRT